MAIFCGLHGPYHWLAGTEQYIGQLVQLCPDAILGRYLVVTSTDSGIPPLTDAHLLAGWSLRSGMAYSPRVSNLEELFYQSDGEDATGFDEWFLFDLPPPSLGARFTGNPFEKGNEPQPGLLHTFVNWGAFVIHDSNPSLQVARDMFWKQMDWVQPDVYIGDGGDNLTFISKDEALFKSVHLRLAAADEAQTRI